ncbi:MAG: hypothetical protein DME34_08875, partial [Verrucomicrobia bacterium]
MICVKLQQRRAYPRTKPIHFGVPWKRSRLRTPNRGGLGGLGIAVVALCYAAIFLLVGRALWNKPNLRIPGGLLLTIAVCMVPLATYGIERWLGFWPDRDPGAYERFHPLINGSWIVMEIATVVAGA